MSKLSARILTQQQRRRRRARSGGVNQDSPNQRGGSTEMIGACVNLTTPGSRAWARSGGPVKVMDNVALLREIPDGVTRIWRHYFEHIDLNDPRSTAHQLISSLSGYRHPKLYVEGFFELEPIIGDEAYADFMLTVVDELRVAGLKMIGPVWGSGAFSPAAWAWFRINNWFHLDGIAIQAYWASAGFSPWNALRYRVYWKPSVDPPLFIVECGRDRVRDGDNNVNGGYIGSPGWRSQGISAETYRAELVAFGKETAKDGVDALIYEAGPTPDWTDFSIDDLAPITPAEIGSTAPQPQPGGTPMADYKAAIWTSGVTNFGYPMGAGGRQGHQPVAICDHIAEGDRDGVVAWFRNPASAVSSQYLVCKNGGVLQFVREADPAWTNGIPATSDLSIPWIKDAVEHNVNLNLVTISIEHEGMSGEPMPEVQYQATIALHRDIFKRYGWPVTDHSRIVGHFQINSVDKLHCPGWSSTMWARLRSDLAPPVTATVPAEWQQYGATWEKVAITLKGVADDALATGRKAQKAAATAAAVWGKR